MMLNLIKNITAIFISVLFLSCYAHAHEIEIGYNFYTKHTNRDDSLEPVNEQNHGILLSIDNWEALIFKTSKDRDGLFLGRNFWEYDYEPWDNGIYGGVNIHGGILKGYAHNSVPSCLGFIPMIAPSFEAGYRKGRYGIALDTLTSIRPWNLKGITTWMVKGMIVW